ITDWSAELLSLLPQPWLGVDNENDVELRMWRKAALNCIVNPLTALLDCENGALLDRVDSPIVSGLLDELTTLLYHASGLRLALAPGELRSDLLNLLRATASNSSSMREDLRHGRETEIDQLNGMAARLARQYGLDLPLNEGLAGILRAIANRKRL
ncbi:MAG: hypothetical protein M3R04_09310, partial [bacterium]|nr:hypothetical protein [bacterium]